jgi:hypothetical protein
MAWRRRAQSFLEIHEKLICVNRHKHMDTCMFAAVPVTYTWSPKLVSTETWNSTLVMALDDGEARTDGAACVYIMSE